MPPEILRSLKKYVPVVLQAQADNMNEADTVMRLIKIFEDVLGYDALSEISRETQMKSKYVDIALKVDGTIRLLVEAKAAGVALRDRHIEQAQSYASRNNFRWVILTNGVAWHLYHLTFEEGIEYQRAYTVDLSETNALPQSAALLALLHRQSIKKGELDDYWQKQSALSPSSLGRALFHESVLRLIRRELRRDEGLLVDQEDLAAAIREMLTVEAREQMGPIRIRKKKARTRKSKPAEVEDEEESAKEEEDSEETTPDE